MIKGAAAGMLLPAMLATPSGQAALARGLYSGALPNIVAPLLTGATLNLGRKLEPNADSK
jgi:elongation factor P hydroxylase